MSNQYERVYEVTLLDDLHNYFPAVLYDPERFRTVSELLAYIRQRTIRRFNLFEYGARQYSRSRAEDSDRVPQNTYTRQPPVVNRWAPPVATTPLRTSHAAQFEFDLTNTEDLSILLPLIRNLDRLVGVPSTQPIQRAHGANRFTGLFQDIVIHASQDLIDNGSSLRTLLMDLEENCSICQDRMRQGENIRRLNACQHEFHGACVDNWFLRRSVLCPICRHDIRDPTPVLRSPILSSTQPSEQQEENIPPINLGQPEGEEETDEEENIGSLRRR
jgi:hypothetical protein